MNEKTYTTPLGKIHYWVHLISPDAITLVFLPGLTADHRLFDKQIAYFEGKYNVLVWDAPGHAASWPYALKCPALLICGEQDKAGSCIRYNKAWHEDAGIPLECIKDAGHNSNTDQPEVVNRLIEQLAHAAGRYL